MVNIGDEVGVVAGCACVVVVVVEAVVADGEAEGVPVVVWPSAVAGATINAAAITHTIRNTDPICARSAREKLRLSLVTHSPLHERGWG
jgi:hypothetical protein